MYKYVATSANLTLDELVGFLEEGFYVLIRVVENMDDLIQMRFLTLWL